jgi:spore coat protein U-like protein
MYKINRLNGIWRLPAAPAALFVVTIFLLSHTVINLAATSAISMSAIITANCKFTGGNTSMNFGSYDPTDANISSPLNSATTFTLRCSQGSSATISINEGLYPLGNFRRLRSGVNDFLNYNLFQDAGRNALWNTANTVSYQAGNNNAQTFTIYGQVPAGQVNVGVGSYSDTVTISVTF